MADTFHRSARRYLARRTVSPRKPTNERARETPRKNRFEPEVKGVTGIVRVLFAPRLSDEHPHARRAPAHVRGAVFQQPRVPQTSLDRAGRRHVFTLRPANGLGSRSRLRVWRVHQYHPVPREVRDGPEPGHCAIPGERRHFPPAGLLAAAGRFPTNHSTSYSRATSSSIWPTRRRSAECWMKSVVACAQADESSRWGQTSSICTAGTGTSGITTYPSPRPRLTEALVTRRFAVDVCVGRFLPYTMVNGPHYPLLFIRAYLRTAVRLAAFRQTVSRRCYAAMIRSRPCAARCEPVPASGRGPVCYDLQRWRISHLKQSTSSSSTIAATTN